MFTTVAWSESQDTAGVLTSVAGVSDAHVRVEGDNIVVPSYAPNLVAVFAIGATISQAQIESPSLRRFVNIDVEPVNVGAEPIVPTPLAAFFDHPIALDPAEPLRAWVAEAAAGAERETVLAWLADGPLAPVGGEVFTVRATSTATLVAYAWTLGSLTFSQALPAGNYQVVGMRAESAGLIAARLVFVGGGPRPGCIGYDAAVDVSNPSFRYGQLGVWGEFAHNEPPSVEFLSVSADASETVWLDLVRM